jgi:hypothetical protein
MNLNSNGKHHYTVKHSLKKEKPGIMAEKNPEEYFNELKAPIVAQAAEKQTPINMPPEEAAHEARRIAGVAVKFDSRLRNESNIDPELLDTIVPRAEAFTYTVSLRETYMKGSSKEWQQWLSLKKEGYDLRRVLFVKLDYAYRKNEALLARVTEFKKGRGDLDLIKDLLSCHTSRAQNVDLVNAAKVDAALFERALQIHKTLGQLIVTLDINVEKLELAELYSSYAWTYFMKAASEIYKAGRCVFVSEPQIEELFYVDFLQKKKTSAGSSEETTPELVAAK